MAQQADFTVFDGATTPVSHTLVGVGVQQTPLGLVATWREQLANVAIDGQVRFTAILSKLKNGVTRTVTRVEVPVQEAVSGVNSQGYTAPPKVAYTDRYELVGLHGARSTEATKRIALQMLINRLNNVSTSVAAVTAGVNADLHLRQTQVN